MIKRFCLFAVMFVWSGAVLAREKGEVTLPQLETDHYSSQIFWLLLTFALLYILISKSALPSIHEVMEKRRHRIERDLEQAERLAAQAKIAKEDYELIYKQALQKSNDLMLKLTSEIDSKAHVENAKLDAQIVQIMHKGELEIEQRCEKLANGLQNLSVDLVQILSQEITGKTANADHVNKIIAKTEGAS